MNDVTTTIFADFGNLLSHLNVFSNHKHMTSCLICSNYEESSTNIYKTKKNKLYTTPTSSDLILLHSGNGQRENRQLIILNSQVETHGESVLERELRIFLHFDVFRALEKAANVAILVIVVGPECKNNSEIKETIAKTIKQFILIVPEYDKSKYENFSTANIVYYKDYESTLKSLVHISMITKQRARIQDVKKYMNTKYALFQAKKYASESECLFI